MSIEEIIKITTHFEDKGIGFIITISVLVIVTKSKAVKNILSKLLNFFVDKLLMKKESSIEIKLTESDLIHHDIFSYIEYWTQSNINKINFSTEFRTMVFRKYLKIYLNTYSKEFKTYLIDRSYKVMGDAELRNSIQSLLTRIEVKYEENMIEAGIPQVVIEKMRISNTTTSMMLFNTTENICDSLHYKSEYNYLKIYSIMNTVQGILDAVITQSEKTCNSINGELSGKTYIESGRKYTEPTKKSNH